MKMTEDLELIELNEKVDLMAIKTECPSCGDGYMYGIPYAQVPCRKCGISYRTDFKQDILTKKMRQIEDRISDHPIGVRIRVTAPYRSALIHLRYNKMEQKCWDVSEISHNKEEYKYCMSCGVCMECFTCKHCGKSFQRDKHRRKQKCPECHSNDYIRTYFKEAKTKENETIKSCPECRSNKIKLTRTKMKSKCHLCNSKKLSETKVNLLYELKIERKKAYRK